MSRIKKLLNRPRLMHYVDIFVAAFGTALYFERDDILGAHGLNAIGCLVFAACVAGGKAVLESYRKAVIPAESPAPITVVQHFAAPEPLETSALDVPASDAPQP